MHLSSKWLVSNVMGTWKDGLFYTRSKFFSLELIRSMEKFKLMQKGNETQTNITVKINESETTFMNCNFVNRREMRKFYVLKNRCSSPPWFIAFHRLDAKSSGNYIDANFPGWYAIVTWKPLVTSGGLWTKLSDETTQSVMGSWDFFSQCFQ